MLKVYLEEGVKRDKPFIERDTTTETEQVGYVDTESQVKRMLLAGENLMAYHRQAYDYPDGEFDLRSAQPDPTMKVGFDPADASFFIKRAKASLEAAKAAGAAKQIVDKEKDAGEGEAQA